MGAFGGIAFAALTVLLGVFYQFAVKDTLYVLGITREVQTIGEFPNYECRSIRHELIESCEDFWLDSKDRKLYAACGNLKSRVSWLPCTDALNATGRKRTDHITVLNIDEPGADELYGLRKLEVSDDFKGVAGTKDLDLHGFDVEVISDTRLRFFIINHRPPFDDASGKLLNATEIGANSTVEVFEHEIGSSTLEFIKTIANDQVIETPNNLAVTGDGGFLLTNDHPGKVGLRRKLSMLLGGGSIAHYSPTSNTQLITPQPSPTFPASELFFPNGIVRGKDNLYYMVDSATGKISVFTLSRSQPPQLQQIDELDIKLSMDNLSVDSDGTIWAAGFPKAWQYMLHMIVASKQPEAASTIVSVRNVGEGKGNLGWKREYLMEKVLEDGKGEILPLSTVAVHDVKTGRLFASGILGDVITICEKRK